MLKDLVISTMVSDIDGIKMTYIFATVPGVALPQGILRLDHHDEPAGYVSSLFVSECVRGNGVGSRLLEKAFEVCREEGKQTIGLSVSNANEGARKLYERLGFLVYLKGHDGYTQLVKAL